MLYPDFKELLSLESKANLIKSGYNKKYVNQLSGNYLSNFKGQGMEFDELREYVYGDDPRAIDWRVSARTDNIHIKTYKEERQRDVLIIVDNNDYMHFGTRTTFKNVIAAKVCALLGFAANKNMDKTGLYIFGNCKNRYEYFRPKNTKNSLLQGLKILSSEQNYSEGYSLDGALFNLRRLGTNPNIVFIISSFQEISEELEKEIFFFNKNAEIVLINIVDDSDFHIPDVGRLVLKFGSKKYLLNSSNKRGMKNYEDNFEIIQEKLKILSAKLKTKIINITL